VAADALELAPAIRASARLAVASFDGMDFMFLFLGCGGGLMTAPIVMTSLDLDDLFNNYDSRMVRNFKI
jgi:hypothetical protein